MQLRRSLGMWNNNMDDSWQWYFSSSDQRLYCNDANACWTMWAKIPTRTRTNSFRLLGPAGLLPADLLRATGYSRADRRYVHDISVPRTLIIPDILPQSVDQAILAAPLNQRWAVLNTIIHEEESFKEALVAGRIRAVCDGSQKEDSGTAAYRLESMDDQDNIFIEGALKVPGVVLPGDSHRCELCGEAAIIILTILFQETYNLTSGDIHIRCDNEASLRIFDANYVFDPQQKDYDLLYSLQKLIIKCPITFHGGHVKGHQDNILYADLDRWSQMNVMMDSLAKAYWNFLASHPESSPPAFIEKFDNEGWAVRRHGVKLSQLHKNSFYDEIHQTRAVKWWVDHGRVPLIVQQDIPWDFIGDAMASLPAHRRRWVTKQFSGNCGIGQTLEKWGYQLDSDCPRCGEIETIAHVTQCPDPSAQTQWIKSLTKLSNWMTLRHTSPDISEAIMHNLNAWRANSEPVPYDGTWPGLRQTVIHQSLIGWQGFTEGLLSRKWADCQQLYYQWLNVGTRVKDGLP
jgi:hypothetical protein